jgi:hypothetical protein
MTAARFVDGIAEPALELREWIEVGVKWRRSRLAFGAAATGRKSPRWSPGLTTEC